MECDVRLATGVGAFVGGDVRIEESGEGLVLLDIVAFAGDVRAGDPDTGEGGLMLLDGVVFGGAVDIDICGGMFELADSAAVGIPVSPFRCEGRHVLLRSDVPLF